MDLKDLMAQAQQMGGVLKRTQEELRHRTVEATVGGGMVEVTVNGAQELVSVRIDPRAVDPRDVEMLQDLIVAAVNQGMQRARELAQSELQKAAGLPAGLLDALGQKS